MRQRGILKGESKHYISLAHTDDDVEATLRAFAESIKAMKRASTA
jgi:glutamate-1-semialdehyde 2,1-aminomutase